MRFLLATRPAIPHGPAVMQTITNYHTTKEALATAEAAIATLPWATLVCTRYEINKLGDLAIDSYAHGRHGNRSLQVYGFGTSEWGKQRFALLRMNWSKEEMVKGLEKFHATLVKQDEARKEARAIAEQHETERKAREAERKTAWIATLRRARRADPGEKLPEAAQYRGLTTQTLMEGRTKPRITVEIPGQLDSPERAAFLSDLDALLTKHGVTNQ